LQAIELTTPTATRRFAAACLARGLVLNWTLHRDTVIRLAPPLTISRREIAHALGVMDAALQAGAPRR
jgi:4-aminobutyrate aminotransferase-like enzyme